ncbi:hypothetical protein AKJ60_00565 [candidate division MSBL1 archaeon SCGC-AAA385M11]|nr:hypothetical protein AKJ60_00565 [candidate division MSBL1 archaeon SCGC-AAA385M11]
MVGSRGTEGRNGRREGGRERLKAGSLPYLRVQSFHIMPDYLDPASRTFNLSKRHWIPAFAGMTAWSLCILGT